MPDLDAGTIAGMRGLDEHFHAEHDDEDSVEECCITAILEAAGFADTFEAYEDGRKDGRASERQHEAAALEAAVVPFGDAVKELRRIEREFGRAEGRDAERQRIRDGSAYHSVTGNWTVPGDLLVPAALQETPDA